MRFKTALVSLWLVCLLDLQLVSGGPASYGACIAACNAAWFVCVGGISLWTAFAGGIQAVQGCTVAYEACVASCFPIAAVMALP